MNTLLPSAPPRRILVIAGSDSSAGAGLQADIKTIQSLSGYAITAVTAITVQDNQGVHAIHPLSAELVAKQMETGLANPGADGVKIGMLATPGIVRTVSRILKNHPHLPVVVDPVTAASDGAPLLTGEGVALFREELLPVTTLLTPNLAEAAWLADRPVENLEDMEKAGRILADQVPHVLVKGGHLPGESSTHLLFSHGQLVRRFTSVRFPGPGFHGTGCTLASALACLWGPPVEKVVEQALAYVEQATRTGWFPGPGPGFLRHAWPLGAASGKL